MILIRLPSRVRHRIFSGCKSRNDNNHYKIEAMNKKNKNDETNDDDDDENNKQHNN